MTSPMRQTTSRRKLGATMDAQPTIITTKSRAVMTSVALLLHRGRHRYPTATSSVKKERITHFGMLRKNKNYLYFWLSYLVNRLASRCDALRCAIETSYRNHVIGSTRYVITFLALLFFVSCHLIARRFFLCCKNRGNG